MMPFVNAELPAVSVEGLMRDYDMSLLEAMQQIERLSHAKVAINDRYQVNITQGGNPFGIADGGMVWLSIKRRDKQPIHDWRDLQEIKNLLVGRECEAFEVYPAESRLTDTANQYHLWAFTSPTVRLPVGFQSRMVCGPEEAAKVGAVQRPFTE